MSFPVNYESMMKETANLAMDKSEPGYVRVRALVALVRELSPLNERHLEVKRELNIDEAQVIVTIDREAESLAYMQGVRDGIASVEAQIQAEDDEEPTEEDDDPL